MRRWIEYAVENYRSKNSFGFQLAKDLKERQISQAIEKYAKIVKPEEVVALMDTTVFKSGKTGFLFTERYLYGDRFKEDGPVELMFLESVSVRQENNSCCVLTYDDGRTREVDISVFLDVVDVLNMMIEQRKKHEDSGEDEGEHQKEPDQTGGVEFEKAAVSVEPARITERVGMDGNDGPARDRETVNNAEYASSTGTAEDTAGMPAIEIAESAEAVDLLGDPGTDMTETEETGLPIEIIKLEDIEDLKDTEDIEDAEDTEEPEDSENAEADEAFREMKGDWPKDTAGQEESFEQVLALAESGDEAAMYRLAVMYDNGQQPDKGGKQALHWFRESAKAEYVPAMLQMMQFYKEGKLVKQNLQLAMSWVKKAAATGDPKGQFALAKVYIYGLAGKQDVDAGLAILGERAAMGDESARQMMERVREEMKEAKERFDAGIRNPSTASGYYEMGMYCQKGDGYYHYPKEAVEYFQKAAEKDHVDAQYQLACAYCYGDGVRKNEEMCIEWLKKAASKSHKEATELLREILEKQRIRQEKAEFKNHLRQAEKGDCYAQARVAELYIEGTGVKKDVKKAIEWYEKAAESDEGYAARELAKIYSAGEIVAKDEERAAYWRMVGGILDEF